MYQSDFRIKKYEYDSPRTTLRVLGENPTFRPKNVKLTVAKRRANQRAVDGSTTRRWWSLTKTFISKRGIKPQSLTKTTDQQDGLWYVYEASTGFRHWNLIELLRFYLSWGN